MCICYKANQINTKNHLIVIWGVFIQLNWILWYSHWYSWTLLKASITQVSFRLNLKTPSQTACATVTTQLAEWMQAFKGTVPFYMPFPLHWKQWGMEAHSSEAKRIGSGGPIFLKRWEVKEAPAAALKIWCPYLKKQSSELQKCVDLFSITAYV